MTAFRGAGAALGAVGNTATSTFEAVSGTIASGGTGGYQHTRSPSLLSYSQGSLELRPHHLRALNESSSLSCHHPAQSSSTTTLTPVRPQSRQFQELNSRALSASLLLTSPFTSIAAIASAAVCQVPLEDIRDKIGRASSLLNSLRGSLFEELAHLQSHHTKELDRAMRDFGARQLQIEKSRLRDMMEILGVLPWERQ
ncbi:MAG: hypothetical protein J3R72DRAFT_501692 [Linnemannia gamsii]|nr:MAG: hypothetical protein J3R72DRAFT_501692 [Linnemannia gamsii]